MVDETSSDPPQEAENGLRKIIHVDMDAFFASVEQRDFPELRGKPVAVGGAGGRGVVAAASYEAREFGVRSAMPSVTAKRKCPDLIFAQHRFEVYREVSQQIRAIFRHFTPHVEPLSLDEAFLDVTDDIRGIGTATRIAEMIRAQIKEKTQLTASAGVSYNKFLAKLASDENKPDGICVIRPGDGARFAQSLEVRRFHGVGPKSAEKMAKLGIKTGADLASKDRAWLAQNFGSFGDYLFRASRGVDLRPVRANRIRKSVGGERTFAEDISAAEDLSDTLEKIIAIVWGRIVENKARGRTVTLKLKYNNFQTITRAHSLEQWVAGEQEFAAIARAILAETMPLALPIRLMGLTLSNLEGAQESKQERVQDDAQLSLL